MEHALRWQHPIRHHLKTGKDWIFLFMDTSKKLQSKYTQYEILQRYPVIFIHVIFFRKNAKVSCSFMSLTLWWDIHLVLYVLFAKSFIYEGKSVMGYGGKTQLLLRMNFDEFLWLRCFGKSCFFSAFQLRQLFRFNRPAFDQLHRLFILLNWQNVL